MKKIIKTIFSALLVLVLCCSLMGCRSSGSERLAEITQGRAALKKLDKETATIEDIVDVLRKYRLCEGDIWGEYDRPYDTSTYEYKIWSERLNISDNMIDFFAQNDGTIDITKSRELTSALIKEFGFFSGYCCAMYCCRGVAATVPVAVYKNGHTVYESSGARFIEYSVNSTEDKETMAKEALYNYLNDPESLILRSVYLSAPSYESLDEFDYETKSFSWADRCVDFGAFLTIKFNAKNSFGGYGSQKIAVFKVVLDYIHGVADKDREVTISTRVYKYKNIYIG